MPKYDENGYIGKRRVREHQAVIARLGIIVLPGQVIHHRDGNGLNNNPSNLQVMSISEHIRLHTNTLDMPKVRDLVTCICPICKQEREIAYEAAQDPSFTGLCALCNSKVGAHCKRRKSELKCSR